MSELRSHPALELMDPARRTLVRIGPPFSSALNPFLDDGVTIRPAILYADTFNSKAHVAYELVAEGIRSGQITKDTVVLAASSGNTGLGVAQFCKALGVKCTVIMQSDTPAPKVGIIAALGNPVDVLLVSSGTVATARSRGAEPGHYDTDQYGRPANLVAQYKYLMPQLFQADKNLIDVLVVPGGTLGTAGGAKKFVEEHGLKTKIVLALCADGDEVPGARDEERIRRDVKIASIGDFHDRMYGNRYQSFLASYAAFPESVWTPGGPTSGLALSAALRFVKYHKDAKTLDGLRGNDGKIRVMCLFPDDYRPYADLYRSTLKAKDFSLQTVPIRRLLNDDGR